MKKIGLFVFAALAIFGLSAFGLFTKKIKVNGEKVEVENGIYAKFSTSLGDILIELNTEKAPMTAANFVLLAEGNMPYVSEDLKEKPFFNGLTFHRVIPNFMIQGGDPKGNGMGGPGYQFPNETSTELPHDKGVISMANSGPNTNGSQFFITVAETKQLDGSYNVFGKVLAGQAIADSISKVPRNNRDKPDTPVVMNEVEIIRVGKEFKQWDALLAFDSGKLAFETAQQKAKEEAAAKAAAEIESIKSQFPNATTTASGLMYIIENPGEGPKPEVGQSVDVHYAGYFQSGELFDTSVKEIAEKAGKYNPQREPYAPMKVTYGPQARLISGFKEGMMLLNEGGKARLIIPPSLAYGEKGTGPIPPNSWLIFDIEIVSIDK